MDFASQNLTAGQLNAIVKKLGGKDGAMRLLRGEIVVSVPTHPEFSIWKTIKLGTNLKTADDFRRAIKQANMKISDWGNDILDKPSFTVNEMEMDVDLVNVSMMDLGFKDKAYRRDIIAKTLSLGLELCPAEVGPQLRLQYADQPKGEWLIIEMEPITDPNGNLHVFYVGRDRIECWLRGDYGYPDGFRSAHHRFIFVRPRK